MGSPESDEALIELAAALKDFQQRRLAELEQARHRRQCHEVGRSLNTERSVNQRAPFGAQPSLQSTRSQARYPADQRQEWKQVAATSANHARTTRHPGSPGFLEALHSLSLSGADAKRDGEDSFLGDPKPYDNGSEFRRGPNKGANGSTGNNLGLPCPCAVDQGCTMRFSSEAAAYNHYRASHCKE